MTKKKSNRKRETERTAAAAAITTTQPKAPSMMNSNEPPPKRVYLIRHGESQGQLAPKKQRSTDRGLIDCDLSMQGEFQATIIPRLLGSERYGRIGFVVSSPLTRAVKTSVLGFPNKNIVVHYDIAELGGRSDKQIPENQPRRLKDVVADTGGQDRIDGSTFSPHPSNFPYSHEKFTGIERKQRVMGAWPALWGFAHEKNCDEFAVVCHYNIIRMALQNNRDIRPVNATPIECLLYRSGRIELVGVLSKPIQNLFEALGIQTAQEIAAQDGDDDNADYDDEGYMVFD